MTSRRTARRAVTWLLLVPALALMTVVVPARADAHAGWTWSVTQRYIGSDLAPWTGAGICSQDGGGVNIGIVCFGPTGGDFVWLRIHDDSGLPVGGVALITDGHGVTLYRRQFCGRSGPIPAIPGLLTLDIRAQSGYSLTCRAQASLATKGRVRATFFEAH